MLAALRRFELVKKDCRENSPSSSSVINYYPTVYWPYTSTLTALRRFELVCVCVCMCVCGGGGGDW